MGLSIGAERQGPRAGRPVGGEGGAAAAGDGGWLPFVRRRGLGELPGEVRIPSGETLDVTVVLELPGENT